MSVSEKKILQIGQKAYFHKTITETDVYMFAGVTGDFSRVHVDAEFAKSMRFGRPIAHGLIASSLLSTIMGTLLPGSGTLFLDQYCEFKAPTFFGDTITAEIEFSGCAEKNSCYIGEFKGKCTNQHGEVVVEGLAHQMMSKDFFVVKS
jgi:3-hydroxybutyryl-CoA dehydratase